MSLSLLLLLLLLLQLLPVLPIVVPVLLEALSGFEDARMNYVEQVCGVSVGWVFVGK